MNFWAIKMIVVIWLGFKMKRSPVDELKDRLRVVIWLGFKMKRSEKQEN